MKIKNTVAVKINSQEDFDRFLNIIHLRADSVQIFRRDYDPEMEYALYHKLSYMGDEAYYWSIYYKEAFVVKEQEHKDIILSIDDFDLYCNPYNDVELIEKAQQFVERFIKEDNHPHDPEFIKGLKTGFIEGYIIKQTE